MTGPLTALNLAFVNYFKFSGRATRAEFWWFTLVYIIVGAALLALDFMTIAPIFLAENYSALATLGFFDLYYPIFAILTAIPYLSLSIRRLHDVGFSGFWWLLNFIPFVGSLALIVLYCIPGNNNSSHHGGPRSSPPDATGKQPTADAHKRAMQGYALLFDKDKPVTAEVQAARKAEISNYYRQKVLKPVAGV
ncbi:DUF805 domain-containing protein [Sulfitobacter guttiformis]|uniref:Uncharacterized membrane protein YhaH (DUF805 family) n=1 Tax=Sulfitobacter guttiformis TaxID=74349 RepID=A0A420DQG0_9RHOB|nr:DUF805 domain-containing protein [Sulfitobacter guttiformis]KIN73784.1 Integral membrane protein [Sulfitobacter guttiformis KCTC 32187]RKE96418.1 uncharacterized membrane protein YhaH (DUF805 family) [Sulfitobacter guttiformis]